MKQTKQENDKIAQPCAPEVKPDGETGTGVRRRTKWRVISLTIPLSARGGAATKESLRAATRFVKVTARALGKLAVTPYIRDGRPDDSGFKVTHVLTKCGLFAGTLTLEQASQAVEALAGYDWDFTDPAKCPSETKAAAVAYFHPEYLRVNKDR